MSTPEAINLFDQVPRYRYIIEDGDMKHDYAEDTLQSINDIKGRVRNHRGEGYFDNHQLKMLFPVTIDGHFVFRDVTDRQYADIPLDDSYVFGVKQAITVPGSPPLFRFKVF
ncbi:hypothetical protein COEREDRAFT_85056 [Coemansia reversa NRRL 1564]|uniref:Uncharacterized protein n=1 Tax=Coemansia reversa (strain ATCC 12441 / NRRL 1564) TaxID=763665 RepID=A0A2G5BII9_COERN|nr:hypothetical protein COEREDRAFT_85056 [Coemansia reversa NRRL 1564]|eukprot:PIA18577.1 hypothetical protein COEREDRAFT_85056 [Coemansia reversa NRRL 1564]